MNPARLQHILKTAAPRKILVLGDLMLDEFVWGSVARISPEAPVPVVEVDSTLAFLLCFDITKILFPGI
jgi:D-beta-D-heptose 7-phosphate kinase/D-beta-D-heptose 1-phosphate adenosyltransferase